MAIPTNPKTLPIDRAVRQKPDNLRGKHKCQGECESTIYIYIMFLKEDINETFITKFEQLGITSTDDIITILNQLDNIAEIGYAWYVKNNNLNKY